MLGFWPAEAWLCLQASALPPSGTQPWELHPAGLSPPRDTTAGQTLAPHGTSPWGGERETPATPVPSRQVGPAWLGHGGPGARTTLQETAFRDTDLREFPANPHGKFTRNAHSDKPTHAKTNSFPSVQSPCRAHGGGGAGRTGRSSFRVHAATGAASRGPGGAPALARGALPSAGSFLSSAVGPRAGESRLPRLSPWGGQGARAGAGFRPGRSQVTTAQCAAGRPLLTGSSGGGVGYPGPSPNHTPQEPVISCPIPPCLQHRSIIPHHTPFPNPALPT